jgi:hypothetical protein
MFGHGPVIHEKVLEVPLAEGLVPKDRTQSSVE